MNSQATDTSYLEPWQTQFGELPWVALVLDSAGQMRGAGTLIHPRVVLTVAHPFGIE